MRIISGIRKGKKLIVPKNSKIRPTTDNTKEFIFNYLSNSVAQKKILDLFSGTGNLGIEALSRGASQVIFVEKDKALSRILHENLKLTQFESQSKVIISDVFKFIKRLRNKDFKFDLIFADPPYESNLHIKLLNIVDESNILQKNGVLIFEHRSNELIYSNFDNINLYKTKILGNTTISFFKNIGGIN